MLAVFRNVSVQTESSWSSTGSLSKDKPARGQVVIRLLVWLRLPCTEEGTTYDITKRIRRPKAADCRSIGGIPFVIKVIVGFWPDGPPINRGVVLV